jgi:ribosomal protein L25 (general stress protein Ctc)
MQLPAYVITGLAIVGTLALGWSMAWLNPSTRQKAKWWALAAIAIAGGLLAIIYGKETASVLDLKVKEHNARGKLLNAQREAALERAEAADDEEERAAFIERADTLSLSAADLQRAKLKLLEDTGDLESDADLARSARARNHSRVG